MAMRKIQVERVQNLNRADVREGDYVLYWMQSSQRAEQNHALEYAVQRAPRHRSPRRALNEAREMRRRLLGLVALSAAAPALAVLTGVAATVFLVRRVARSR
jgi:hypothetical protein